jgi:hypothetical protein
MIVFAHLAFAADAQATTITFGNTSEFYVQSYTEAGFEFTFDGGFGLGYHGVSAGCFPTCADNRTPWLALLGDSAESIVMRRVDDQAFFFHGFDGAESFALRPQTWAGGIQVTGLLENHTVVTQTFALDGANDGLGGKADFQRYVSLDFFDRFIELTFTGISNVAGNRDFTIDNVVVSAASPVPEPASMLLVASGLVGLVRYRTRRS